MPDQTKDTAENIVAIPETKKKPTWRELQDTSLNR